jgi:hypothetical protein
MLRDGGAAPCSARRNRRRTSRCRARMSRATFTGTSAGGSRRATPGARWCSYTMSVRFLRRASLPCEKNRLLGPPGALPHQCRTLSSAARRSSGLPASRCPRPRRRHHTRSWLPSGALTRAHWPHAPLSLTPHDLPFQTSNLDAEKYAQTGLRGRRWAGRAAGAGSMTRPGSFKGRTLALLLGTIRPAVRPIMPQANHAAGQSCRSHALLALLALLAARLLSLRSTQHSEL